MSTQSLEVAAVGDRITHAFSLEDGKTLLSVAVKLGENVLSKKGGKQAFWGAIVGKAVTELGGKAIDAIGQAPECPSPRGSIAKGSVNAFVGPASRPVALAGEDPVGCDRHKDRPIRQGSASVQVNDRPLARRTDETKCGAHIGEGEPTVFAGSDTRDCAPVDSVIPSWLKSGATAALVVLGQGGKLDLAAAVQIGASIAGLGQSDLDKAAGAIGSGLDALGKLGVSLGGQAKALVDDALAALDGAELGKKLAEGYSDTLDAVLGAMF